MILDLLAEGDRNPLSKDQYTRQQFLDAKKDEVVLAPQKTPQWVAPHFVWAVQKEMADKLCGVDAPTCDTLEAGGLRVTTHARRPHPGDRREVGQGRRLRPQLRRTRQRRAQELGLKYEPWMKNLRGKDLHNGAHRRDSTTRPARSSPTSAAPTTTRPTSTPAFQPKFDVAGSGWRQPGSAFKPFNYLTGIDDKAMTAASMFMDAATDFGGGYTPSDADNLERGPVRVRNALQFSLNIPSVKATVVNTPEHLFARAKDFGMTFQTDTPNGRAGDRASASRRFGRSTWSRPTGRSPTAASRSPTRRSSRSRTQSGKDAIPTSPSPRASQAASPQAAFIVTDILAGNTNPKVNPFWGKFDADERGRASAARRRSRPGRTTTPRTSTPTASSPPPTAEGRAAGEYALVGRRVERQQRQHARVDAEQAGLLDRRHDLRLAGLHGRGHEEVGDQRLQGIRTASTKAKVDPFTGAQAGGPGSRRSTSGSSTARSRRAAIPARHLRRRDTPVRRLREGPRATG